MLLRYPSYLKEGTDEIDDAPKYFWNDGKTPRTPRLYHLSIHYMDHFDKFMNHNLELLGVTT